MIVTVEFVNGTRVQVTMSYETWKDVWRHRLYEGKLVKAVEVDSSTKHAANRIVFQQPGLQVARNHADWLSAYIDYAGYTEAPKRMHFWCGVAAVAGALRRKVWIDQAYFKWHSNSYIILVAPPGIVSKSTTANVAMRLLRQVPGVKFGPDVVTWQALVGAFAESLEEFEWNGSWYPMSAITIESSEFGNLLNPQDKDMVDLLVNLWDGKQGAFEKKTKMSGNDTVVNPWINLIACTTPSWIAGNFPEYMIGGGFTSRCLFVYAEEKEKYVAYPGLIVPEDQGAKELALVQDLEHIAMTLKGEYRLSDAAVKWGEAWYRHHYSGKPTGMEDDRFGGYLARKQTHIHKLAMILSASRRDELIITDDELAAANDMVSDLEKEMPKVFGKIGRSDMSVQTERLLAIIKMRGPMSTTVAYKAVHSYFPSSKEFTDVLEGLLKAGLLTSEQTPGGEFWLKAVA